MCRPNQGRAPVEPVVAEHVRAHAEHAERAAVTDGAQTAPLTRRRVREVEESAGRVERCRLCDGRVRVVREQRGGESAAAASPAAKDPEDASGAACTFRFEVFNRVAGAPVAPASVRACDAYGLECVAKRSAR